MIYRCFLVPIQRFILTADSEPSAISTTPIVATGILVPISNIKKSLNLDESGPIILVNSMPKLSPLWPKPSVAKEVPGKIAISPLKSKTIPRKQRIRRTKKEIERERKSTEESKLNESQKSSTDEELIDSNANECDKTTKKSDPNVSTNDKIAENEVSKPEELQETANSARIETTEPNLPQPELSNDILASLQIPQNDSPNNESMSPTAAFLMSFPVVSSAGVRIGDDEQETHDSQSLQQSSHNKPASETNILENISSLLTTKDYERFVEDAVKNDVPNCDGNAKPSADSQSDDTIEKRTTSMSFDFQLKPITSSCEVKTDTRASVTSTSTYLPEIGNLNYKNYPKRRRKSTSEETFTNVSDGCIGSVAQDNLLPSLAPTKTSTVSSEDYVRNHSSMDFMTTSSTILHNLEPPPTKILRLSDPTEQAKRTSFDNSFLRNPRVVAPSIPTTSVHPSVYSSDKIATPLTQCDTKTTTTNNPGYDTTVSIPSVVPGAVQNVTLVGKPRKIFEAPKECFSFPEPLAVSAIDTSSSIKTGRDNQFNSLYSYPTNTSTYSSTSVPNFSINTNGNASKSYHDIVVKGITTTASIDKTIFKSDHSTTSAADGFYTSLTSIGTTHSNLPQYPAPIMRPNMYTSALSLSSSNQKVLDYAPQTPFTFSLTTPINATPNTKNSMLASCQQSQNYLPSAHTTSYQDYNPFAFENISSISTPITPYPACRETSQFSFSLTSTTNKVTSKNPSQSSFSIDQNFLTETRVKPLTPAKADGHPEKKVSYKQCSKNEIASHSSEDNKNKEPSGHKVEKSGIKQHVNWMTSTTDLQKNDYPIIPPLDYTQSVQLSSHYLAQPNAQLTNSQKNADIYFGHQIGEENFQWSPNKMIDTPNISSSTLPNLHGDLALNNSLTPKPQSSTVDKSKNTSKSMLSSHMQQSHQNVGSNPTNSYFSVSQLVDNPKTMGQSKPFEDSVLPPKPSKTSSIQSRYNKPKDTKKVVKSSSNFSNFTPNIFVDSFAYNEPQKQNNSNNYSAEALISIHPSKRETKSISNYANQSEYCNQLDNYNNMDYINEPNYNYYNNSYFPQIPDNDYFCGGTYSDQQFHNKTSRTSAAPATKHLTTISDSGYASHTSQNNLYTFTHPTGKLCQQSSQYKNPPQLSTSYNQSRSYSNNTNKKQYKQDLFPTYDPNPSTNYFPPSLNINSPMIPHPPLIPTPNISSNDDFNYASHLNYPTSLSKASAYGTTTQQMNESNQSNSMPHGSASVGNLVTNFNLSTICPEINDKTRQQNW